MKAVQFEEVLGTHLIDKRIEILRSIERVGSISEAARVNGVSYKAAWQAIETLSNLAGVDLLEKNVGGSGGGGARVTAAGLQVLQAADLLSRARTAALQSIRAHHHASDLKLSTFVGVGLRTSMRNQLPCTITSIDTSAKGVRVVMTLGDGQTLTARITEESLQLLGLRLGMTVIAMCKATAVRIAPTIVAIGEINLLSGTVTRRLGVKRDGQISMALAGSLQLAGFAEPNVDLKLRQQAQAAIDESAVVIALPG